MGFNIPSVSIPSPRDVFNDTKDKVDQGRNAAADRVNSGRDFVTDKIDNGRGFVTDKIDNGRGFVTDRIDDGRGFVTDKIDDGRGFVTDKIDDGRGFVIDKVDDGRGFVTDRIDDGRGFVTDKVDDGRGFVSDQLDSERFIFDRFKEKADDIANDAIDNVRVTREDVYELQPGDSISTDAKAEGGGGVIVGAEHGITVSLDEDGVYTVSQEASVKGGVGFKDFAEVGGKLGGAREYTFDNPEDAARAADILQKQALVASGSAVVGGTPLVGPLGQLAAPLAAEYTGFVGIEDQKWLDQHTSKLEVSPGVYGKLGVPKTGLELDGLNERFDPEGDGTGALAGVEVELSKDTSIAVEYDNGERTAIVETRSISLSGNIDAETIISRGSNPTPGVSQSGGNNEQQPPLESGGLEVDGEVSVQLEKRTSVETGEVEYSIKIGVEGDLQDGRGFTAEYAGTIREDQIDDVISDLAKGDVDSAVESVGLQGESYETDIDRNGFDFGFVVGEVGAGKERRDIDEDSRSSVEFG